jgi:sugar/nucleoside kinase (ribokinase family)
MYDICCVGHITSDKVVNVRSVNYMPGGTAFYFSYALSNLDINYLLVTSLAVADMNYVADMENNGIEVKAYTSAKTVFFENIYGDNQDERTQNVLQKADPFSIGQFDGIDSKIFHLGPLLADDISVDMVRMLSKKGRISLDVQGYLRKVENKKVYATNWPDKKEVLQYVDILKADVAELKALTGCNTVDEGVKILVDWGVKEAVITNGSQGSLIYGDGSFYTIPAYSPLLIVDATGCGDTYMAGYLYQRVKDVAIQDAAKFAAAMSGLKTGTQGPFTGTEEEVKSFLEQF